MFSILTNMLSGLQWDLSTYTRFENKTVLLIFQLWQLEDSECAKILEVTEYLCYFGNNAS